MLKYTSKLIIKKSELYEERAKNIDLIWCQQIVSLLDSYQQGEFSINEIGGN